MTSKTFLFPSPPNSKLLTLPNDQERRDLRTYAPYVPSDQTVVDAMLDLADLTPDDTLMDLGCGDGRIVFGAARRGSRAIGVDIDPVFVAENMKKAMADPELARATFINANLITVDLSPATVITCYLLPHAMDLLKPKFETGLRPGTRIVSHAFSLVGWQPVRMAHPEHRLGTVYLWVV
jgi:SAM-dependent methyltransferase